MAVLSSEALPAVRDGDTVNLGSVGADSRHIFFRLANKSRVCFLLVHTAFVFRQREHMNEFALADEVLALGHLVRGTVRRFCFHGLPILLSFRRVDLDSSYFWFQARWVTRVCARTGIVCTCKLPITQIVNSFSFAITQKSF